MGDAYFEVFWKSILHPLLTVYSPDTAFVLAYSVIMLNTDHHNPQVCY